jgi:phage-related protein
MEFSSQDLGQIEKRGSQQSTVLYQISNFKNGFPYIDAKKAATIESGIVRLDESNLQHFTEFFEAKVQMKA